MLGLFAAAGFLVCAHPPAAHAQLTTAAIHGTVSDSSGAIIPDAKVTALDTATNISTVTSSDKNGYFIFPELQVGGPYTVTVTSPGFRNFASPGLMLTVNGNREVDATLNVGAEAQTIEVSASAVQVETSNTQLQQIATAEQLEEIPLEGRDPAGLQKLEPGVVESSDRFGSFSSQGNQTSQNSYLVSGIDINDPALQDEGIQVNPDALAEENIVTSTMNPEYARNSGAVINQILKNGTNSLHGSGFEFYRDTFLNNGNYFSATRPVFHQNLYGGTLGGPVFRNKLFFFLAYQGLRNRTAQTELQPTLSGTKGSAPTGQFAGAFSSDTNYALQQPDNMPSCQYLNGPSKPCTPYSDSLSGTNLLPFAVGGCTTAMTWAQCFDNGGAGNATINVPTSAWSGVASTLINKYVPASNYPNSLYNFNALNTDAQDQGILRFDYTLSSRDTIWASSIFQSSPATFTLAFGGGSFPGFGMNETNHYKLFSASWTHTFSPTMLNELRASYYRNPFEAVGPASVVQPSSLGFAIAPQDPVAGVPFISVGQYFDLGFSFEGPQPRLDTNLTYADNFTWVKGNHAIKFGGQFEQFRVRNPFDVYNNGDFSFQGGTEGGGVYSSGDPLIDFVLGIPDTYYQTNNGFINAVANEIFGYVQDNWKVTPDLTFNYGVAWDVEQPNTNHQDGGEGIVCWTNSSATSGVFAGGPPGLGWPGDPGCNNAGSPTARYNRFGPRIGFAWSPSDGPSALIGRQGEHNFSIRAGFGVFYNRDQEEQSLQNLEDPPFVFVSQGATSFGGSPSLANPYADVAGNGAVANPFPYAPITPKSTIDWSNYLALQLAAFNSNYIVPYTYNFNLNIQRALPGSMVLQIGYVGSLSHRLPSWYEGDNITPAGHAACLANPGCSGDPSSVHLLYPQYTAQSATAPGNPDGLPNGTPYYLSVAEQNTEGSSNYNSLQASLIKAATHGLQFTFAYTYSHALDTGSSYESTTGGDSSYGNAGHVYNYVPGFEGLNYGDSDFDARQNLHASYVYRVPVAGFLKSSLIAREALSGWGVGGLTALESGFPVGVSMGADRSLWCDGYSYFGCPDVPETSSFNIAKYNPRSNTSTHQYFDTTPFSPEPVGTFGNTKRNFFHGPGLNYTNLNLSKNIPFSADGTRYAQLRLEAFNVFNHANFAPPSGNFSSPTFGQVTSVVFSADPNADPQPGRAIQLVAKIYF
jgi:hypothetical protein